MRRVPPVFLLVDIEQVYNAHNEQNRRGDRNEERDPLSADGLRVRGDRRRKILLFQLGMIKNCAIKKSAEKADDLVGM